MRLPRPEPLAGPRLTLWPLSEEHLPGLLAVAADPRVFAHLPARRPETLDELRTWLCGLFPQVAAGLQQPYAIVTSTDEAVIGTTSYWRVDREREAVEIGATWMRPGSWGTGANTEAKFLLLRNAFEVLGCARVDFRTDVRNLRSRRAIEKLGARPAGTVENDLQRPDGTWRTSVYYRIEHDSWPAVKARISRRLSMTGIHTET